MVHLVYCDNAGKNGEKELDKILAGTKTMVVRGAAGRKIPHSRVFAGERLYFMEKGSASITATATVKELQNFVKLSMRTLQKSLPAIRKSSIYQRNRSRAGIRNTCTLRNLSV